MKYMSTNLGMPRVGRKRELKFATEKYWRQEITASELLATATDVVDDIYKQQVTAGIDLIPVNDFSFLRSLGVFKKCNLSHFSAVCKPSLLTPKHSFNTLYNTVYLVSSKLNLWSNSLNSLLR